MVTYPYIFDQGVREIIPANALGKRLTAHIIQTRQPLVINKDLEERMAEFSSSWIGSNITELDRSFAGVPILAGEQVIGVIALGSKQERAFKDSDINLLNTLAANLGVALQNARLFQAEKQRATELAIINSVQEGLASKLDIQAIYDLVGDKISQVCDAQVVVIGSYDFELKLSHAPYYIERGQRFYPEPITTGRAWHNRTPGKNPARHCD